MSLHQLLAHVANGSTGSRFAKLREAGVDALIARPGFGGAVGVGEFAIENNQALCTHTFPISCGSFMHINTNRTI